MGRRKNPLTSHPPPRHLQGLPGGKSYWTYRGREIRLQPSKHIGWSAHWIEPNEEGMEMTTLGTDQQAALANARHGIDIYEKVEQYGDGYSEAATMVHHIIDDMHDSGIPTDRRRVARHIVFGEKGHGPAAASPDSYAAFNALPLDERLKLIDETLQVQKRMGLIPNPTRSEHQRMAKKALKDAKGLLAGATELSAHSEVREWSLYGAFCRACEAALEAEHSRDSNTAAAAQKLKRSIRLAFSARRPGRLAKVNPRQRHKKAVRKPKKRLSDLLRT